MKTTQYKITAVLGFKQFTVLLLTAFALFITGCSSVPQYQTQSPTSNVPNSHVVVISSATTVNDDIVYTNETFSILRKNRSQQIFKDYGVNPTISTEAESVSTFAMDVDTVSYQIAHQSLINQQLPNKASVRVEEFINHFDYNYQSSGDGFSISAEITPSPFRAGFHVLHVGIKAKDVPHAERLPANLVLVADVSSSMASEGKMALQQKAFTTLVSQLSADDTVAIVSYSNNARVALKPTSAKNKSKIYRAIKKLRPYGGTNAASGIRKGYELAGQMAYPGHINRVILTSDGLANIGSADPTKIVQEIKQYKERNIFLTTVGVGKNMYNDHLLEQLANQGNGQYLYFANTKDIQSAFVDGLTTQLQTVAKDAKVQIQFDPKVVSHFRQLGYENRALETQDFLDASKDGGELGANHQVTVLYEIKLRDNVQVDNVATVSVSYKRPQGSAVLSLKKAIPASVIRQSINAASPDTTLAIASAGFSEKLRQSYWSRLYNYNDIHSLITSLPASQRGNDKVRTLLELVSTASRLDHRRDVYEDRYPINDISYEQVPLLK